MNTKRVFAWSIIIALGGFLFGLDTAVISGAEQKIQEIWNLNDVEHGFTVAIALIGTVVGAMLGGIPSDRLGRKKTLFWIAVLFLLSAVGSALATDWYTFLIFRFVGGLGVGCSSVTAPMYISELSPASHRGRLVAMFQFNVVLGILIAFLSNYWLQGVGENAWRWMLGVQAFPSILFMVLVLFIPESPRWLVVKKGLLDEAKDILARINPATAAAELEAIRATRHESTDVASHRLFSKKYGFPVMLAIVFAMFNQLSGINAIIYFAPRIFGNTGLGTDAALLSTAGLGLVNFIFTLLAVNFIDRYGRRTLMFVGSAGLIITLALTAYAFNQEEQGSTAAMYAVPVYLFVYIAFFAFSQGAVIWVFISEIFPNEVRAKGQALGSFTHWIMATVITFVFPYVSNAIGEFESFRFFTVMMVLQLLFVWKVMPETKGRSLEDADATLSSSGSVRNIVVHGLLLLALVGCANPQTTSDSKPVQRLYSEPHRPQLHFSPKEKWMNDPNGLVYYAGEYHLFYQHHPQGDVWGPMHWGHAVSTDLFHWTHLPIALYPDEHGMIFSGSAVVDEKNTSGFGTVENPALVAIYTYHDATKADAGRVDYQTQGLAYSTDKGRTWTKYMNNPIVPNPGVRDFRDPKVFWHNPTQKWIMTLVAGDHAEFYGSKDLKVWTKMSEFGYGYGNHNGVWECPDLIELPIEEETGKKKWVLLISINPGAPQGGSATQYFVGEFDGEKFVCDTKKNHTLWLDYGQDNYAGVTWFNAPENRKIFIGWMSNWDYAQVVPTSPWRSANTLPRELSLVRIDSVLYIKSKVVREVTQHARATKVFDNVVVNDSVELTSKIGFLFGPAMVEGKVEAKDFVITLANARHQKVTIGFEETRRQFYVDRGASGNVTFSPGFRRRHEATRISSDGEISFIIVSDVSSVEVFFDDGSIVFSTIFFPDENFSRLLIGSGPAPVNVRSLTVKQLPSAWATDQNP